MLFAATRRSDRRRRGIGRIRFGYLAVRNAKAPVPYSVKVGKPPPDSIDGIRVQFIDSQTDPLSLARVPHSGPASPAVGSLIPEQQQQRPLVCGLQIQNYDNDVRTGEIAKGYIIIGALGCFVKTVEQFDCHLVEQSCGGG